MPSRSKKIKPRAGHAPDYTLIICIAFLVIFGLIMLSSASSDLGKIKFNNTYYYLEHQLLFGLSLGIVGFFLGSMFCYRYLERLAIPLLILSIVALILVFTPLGFHSNGASRWLNLGPFSVQPAEFLKLTFIVYIAAWLSNPRINRSKKFIQGFLPLLIICCIVGFLIIKQPATTTVAIIMGATLITYFVSGARLSYLVGLILLGVIALVFLIYVTPYRFERVKAFLEKDTNIQASGFHLNQSLIAIGSGGFWGVGYGKSTTKYKYLPEPIGDSIFAVVAEELGFIGVIVLLSVFMTFFVKGFLIAKNSRDQFAKLLAIGITSVLAIQTFINIGAISGLIPLTGVPLPFISYGGTALAIFLTMSGVLVNISKYT